MAGGTLSGTGNTANLTVSGGTFAPGNGTAGSSMTVTGSLTLQSSALYMVQINPATSSFTNVTGAATLGGSMVQAIYANGSYVARQYTILTASGGVSGTFASLADTNLPANFHTTLSYDATHAYLNLVLNFVPPPGSGLSGNQQGAGNAIINYFNSNGTIPLVFGGLTPTGLTQISGETAAGSQTTTFNAMTQFMGLMTDPYAAGRSNGANTPAYADEDVAGNAYAPRQSPRTKNERDAYAAIYSKAPLVRNYDPRWSVWAAGFGGSQTTDGNATQGTGTTTSSLFGVAAGADYVFSPNTVAGFALAGGGTNFSVANGGSGRSDLFQAGAFVRHAAGAAYVTGALAYGWQDVTTDRTVTIAGVDRLRAQFNANAFSGRAEGGYRFVSPWIGGIGITPYAAGQFTTFDLPAYAEQVVSGANTFALAYGSRSVTATRGELGFRADKPFALQTAILTLRGRAAWAHDYNTDRAVGATFQALPGASFVVNGARPASDSALTTASVEIKWTNGWSAAGTYEGEFSNVTASHAGKGVVRFVW
ncbi:autotransporter domain-containing protein [Bradyrhizobium guangdongense]|nr:autotransporter domain-containing protein [Bradyrhizobium guangdongense]